MLLWIYLFMFSSNEYTPNYAHSERNNLIFHQQFNVKQPNSPYKNWKTIENKTQVAKSAPKVFVNFGDDFYL